MEHLSLMELYQMKKRFLKEDYKDDVLFEQILTTIKQKEELLLEDTSATGGPVSGGYVNAQPSGLAGVTIGPNWASTGGVEGDGIASVPYNPSGSNRMFQKMPIPMGKEHGPRTGKKSREKRIDLKALKDVFAKRQDFTAGEGEVKKDKRVLDYNDFLKNDFNTIKK